MNVSVKIEVASVEPDGVFRDEAAEFGVVHPGAVVVETRECIVLAAAEGVVLTEPLRQYAFSTTTCHLFSSIRFTSIIEIGGFPVTDTNDTFASAS